MTEQLPEPPRRPSSRTEEMARSTQVAQERMLMATSNLEALRTETDRVGSLFGFGRRILVPADEIHVVVGHGVHSFSTSRKSEVFGQTAGRPSQYWLNPLTEVIKLKTISFTVPLLGGQAQGIEALDSSKVSFKLWAHAVAKLNPDKAETAAQRVGKDTASLISTITEVATAELIAAAASMPLEEIIAKRQKLAEIASPQVNNILGELGYDLALLTVTGLAGNAYIKLVEQAESRVYKETTIATNVEQLAELQDIERRLREEAEIKATTQRQSSEVEAQTSKKLAAEKLESDRVIQEATITQTESLDIRRNEQKLMQISRQKEISEAELRQKEALNAQQHELTLKQMEREREAQKALLAKVELDKQIGEAEATKSATIQRRETEYQAEILALETQKDAALALEKSEAEARRLALEQIRKIERDAELTAAEVDRLRQKELADAQRAKEIALLRESEAAEARTLKASAEADALRLQTEAQAKSLQVKTQAEIQTDLARAEAEAKATEQRAMAAKIRAEATRAEAAAAGLAVVEVDRARVEVAEKQVAVNRAEGLASAEISMAQARAEAERAQKLREVEIGAQTQLKELDIRSQKELADLYQAAPVLVDLEKMRMQLAHDQEIAKIRAEASLKALQALAPGVKINLFGNGNQAGDILAGLMNLTHSLQLAGEEVPLVGRVLGQASSGELNYQAVLPYLEQFRPYVGQVVHSLNPRVMSTLKVADIVERLGPVVSGQENLVKALDNLRQDANFRVLGDLPIKPLLGLLGLTEPPAAGVQDIPVQEPME